MLALSCNRLTAASASQPNPAVVKVNLFEAFPDTASLFVEGPFTIVSPFNRAMPAGLYLLAAANGRLVLSTAKRTTVAVIPYLTISGDRHGGLALRHHSGVLKRHYRGAVECRVKPDGKLKICNIVPALDYVCAVVGSETMPNWPGEALKAQAVLTQTRLARYRLDDELGDTTALEAYLGSDYARPEVRAAVHCVWGQILTYDKRPIQPFYHSTCAGRTSAAEELFGKAARNLVYLPSVKCDYCRQSPFMVLHASKIDRAKFEADFGRGNPAVISRDVAGRPLEVLLGSGKRIRGYDFWIRLGKKCGWDKVPGTQFSMKSAHECIEFTSRGAGHGVGMCQWGAAGLARAGKSYREILGYYLPGTEIR